jgi:4-hydroxy-3-methylbut-2-en-1-yl diphosphate reductase
MPCDPLGLFPISGVVGRLSAAGLPWVEADLHPATFKNADTAEADLGKELVDQTGDKQGDFHGQTILTRKLPFVNVQCRPVKKAAIVECRMSAQGFGREPAKRSRALRVHSLARSQIGSFFSCRVTINESMGKKLILANPRGFCAGVVRAVDVVNRALEIYSRPLFVRKEIVHNSHVVEELRAKGAVFVDSLDEVPPGKTVVFSAHGVSPQVWEKARAKNLKVIDATCPLVTKVHVEAVRYARDDYTIILVGHPGHDEVIGTMGEAPERMLLVSSVDDVARVKVPDPGKVAYLTQTTLSLEDTRAIVQALRARFPAIQGPPSDDICYATQNRQMAVRELAQQCRLILVVGSANSSNSNRLVEEANKSGARAYLIEDAQAIKEEWLEDLTSVGVTSGASAPEILVNQVIDFFKDRGFTIEDLLTREERVTFQLPPELVADMGGARVPKAGD